MSSDEKLPPRAWLIVALVWGALCLNYVHRLMITTMRGSILEAIPMTEAQFGLLTSVFLVVYAVASPFAGYFADRFNRSHVITGSVLIWSIVTALTAYATTYEQLLATRVLMGLGQAACMPASVALVVDYHRSSTRSLASGLLLSGAMAGGAMSGLGGWVADDQGWAFTFKSFGWVGAGYSVVLLLLLRDAPATEMSAERQASPASAVRIGEAFAHLFTNRGYLVMLVYACVVGVVSWSVAGWMPTFIKEHFKLTQGAAGLYTTICLNVSGLLGMLVGGAWADRWSRTQPKARIFVPVLGLCLAAPSVLLLAKAPLLAMALAGLVGYGIGRHFVDANTMPIMCMVVDARYRATSWGMFAFCSCVVGAVGIYAGGLLRDAQIDISRVFLFAVANIVVGAFLIYSLRRYASAAPKPAAG